MGVKGPLVQGDFTYSKTGLENMYPLVLTSKQVSKQHTREKHKHLTLYVFPVFIYATKMLPRLTVHENNQPAKAKHALITHTDKRQNQE